MNKLLFAIIVLAFITLPGPAAAEDVSIAQFLSNLSTQQRFHVDGLSLVGNDRFTPSTKQTPVERQIVNSLRGYNHIVQYDQHGQIKLVRIVGKKGHDVGPLSDVTPATPQPE